ncbi:hypothetical protein [Sphingomonas sp. 35-24ZXX]|uniref:hypothetical protein n=1 Tax=Sphingomonas sp. 35-24ZXX TaxID=1545915 RepID=UPI0012E09B61|nr:hypothetical protein [Sphingomonas sp. 35-24ZXX]
MLSQTSDPLREAQSLVDWWQLAGVEWDYADAVNDWLADDPAPAAAHPTARAADSAPAARPAAPRAPAPAPAAPRADIALPTDLDAFQMAWRSGALGPDGGDGRHVAPLGVAGAKVMVLADCPMRDDGDTVLSGRSGLLLDNIARACGFSGDDIYRAAYFPRIVLDTQAAVPHVAAWKRIALHHIALVGPQMLVVAGEDTARTLLGHDPSQIPPALHFLNHGGRTVKTVVTRKFSLMLHRIAQEKAMAWQNWQLLLVE